MIGKTLVFGVSLKENRYSNLAIKKLIKSGINTLAFGLVKGNIEDVVIDTELLDYEEIDTVTLYISPKNQKIYYNYIISLKPRRIIFNPGTENLEFYKILITNNIYYEEACTLTLLATNQY
jgi:hypothetical protein